MGPGTGRMLVAAGITAAAAVALDQATKSIARRELRPYEERDLALGGQVGVANLPNYGSAYGLVPSVSTAAHLALTAAFGVGILAAGSRSNHALAAGVGAGLVLGGGIGNSIDRARQGYVTDFLHTTDLFGHYNVADMAIVGGLGLGAGAFLLRS